MILKNILIVVLGASILFPRTSWSEMGEASTCLKIRGKPSGGALTIIRRDRSVSVNTFANDQVADILVCLKEADDKQKLEKQKLPLYLQIDGNCVRLGNTFTGAGISISTTDKGIIQPAAPTDVRCIKKAPGAHIIWKNRDSYDFITLSKDEGYYDIDERIPGTADYVILNAIPLKPGEIRRGAPCEGTSPRKCTIYIFDEHNLQGNPAGFNRELEQISIVGWKDGTPSQAAKNLSPCEINK